MSPNRYGYYDDHGDGDDDDDDSADLRNLRASGAKPPIDRSLLSCL